MTSSHGGPRSRGIGLEAAWTAVSREADERAARNPDLSTDLRLIAAARWRLDRDGHSHFPATGDDGLRAVLSKVDRATGQLTPLSQRATERAIARLVAGDQLSAVNRNSARCLRLPRYANDGPRGAKRSTCPVK